MPRKTRLQNDLLCVEWDVKPIHSFTPVGWCLFAEDGLLRPKRERRSRERSHGSRSRDHKRSRRSRSRDRRGGSRSRDKRRGDREPASGPNGEVFVKQEVEDAAGEYGAAAGENNYYNEHAGIDPANY